VSFAILRVGKEELPEFAGGITSLVVVEFEVAKAEFQNQRFGGLCSCSIEQLNFGSTKLK
jgi:hypothetical protein